MDKTGNKGREATQKAMRLLVVRDRSEKELRERLAGEGYLSTEIDAALTYVKSFGYINDRRYAENYVMSAGSKKSRTVLRLFLQEKGIDEAIIEATLETVPEEETGLVRQLLIKKAGQPHRMDEKELRRAYGYLARKGFSSGDIWKVFREYQADA